MHVKYYDIIVDVFCSVFEQMAFMFGETVEADDIKSQSQKFKIAGMTFTGDMSGSLEMIIEEGMGSVIASNILGIEPEDEKAARFGADSFKEMLNVVCGQCLTNIAGEEPVFNLSVPDIRDIDAEKWQSSFYPLISVRPRKPKRASYWKLKQRRL